MIVPTYSIVARPTYPTGPFFMKNLIIFCEIDFSFFIIGDHKKNIIKVMQTQFDINSRLS